MTAVTEWGFMYKFGVPSQFICKLPYEGHAPAALIYQVGEVFDLLDTNMNGTLDLEWDSEVPLPAPLSLPAPSSMTDNSP